jgi:hypothetical protein
MKEEVRQSQNPNEHGVLHNRVHTGMMCTHV